MRLGDQRKRGGRRVGSGWSRKQRGDCNMERGERRGTVNGTRETEIIGGGREKEQRDEGRKRSKPPFPDGERRENEDGGLRSMTPITLPSLTEGYKNLYTLNVAYCDDHENERSNVRRRRMYPVNVVGAPVERRESRCHGARTRIQMARLPRGERIRPTNLFSRGRG
ncbi:hypothetical protein ALC56_13335 [Trachymyrmex septentrionalis]|uniref:Uncharacterized protein n=1 Tax=Trachymyrmex septentrionalis TaxID=34720 RepID=A0A195EX50_9HYME|nr:hypothetical protein ALC56_13335 [Trachymyrmex septentrionalis]